MNDKDQLYEDKFYEVPKSYENKVPRWLIISYIIFVVWGVIWFALYWNGTPGWIDRGYWYELQKAADTTFPEMGSFKQND